MVGKRLSSEFEQLAGVASTPSTGSPSIAAGSLPPPLQQPGAVLGVGYHHVPQPPPDPPDNLQLPTPHISQSFGQVTGISSGSNHNFSLSSSPQSLLGSASGPPAQNNEAGIIEVEEKGRRCRREGGGGGGGPTLGRPR